MADASLGVARLRTSLDASGLKAGLNQAKGEADQAISAISKQIGGLGREFTVLGNEVKAGLRPLAEYGDALKQQDAELQQLIGTLDRASTEYDEATTHLAAVREELKRVNAELDNAGDKTKSFSDRVTGLGRNLTTVGGALTIGVTAPLTALGVVGVRSAMQLETFAASLNVLIGDAERANRVFDELYEFSAATPFDWRTLTEGTRVLAAFGTEAEDIVPTLSRLGDIAAGTQSDLASLAETYGRVLVTGRMSMDEVNQLAARGVPIYTELASVLGVSTDQVRELVSAGKVGFPELERVIMNLTSEGGKFFGMMDAQADTVQGRLNRLKDSFEQVTDVVGERLLPTFDRLIAAGQRATEWFVNLDESTQGLFVGLGVTLAATGPVLVGVGTLLVQVPKLVTGFQLLRTIMLPLLGPAGVLALLAVGLYAVWTAMDVGRAARLQMAQDFDSLIGKMQTYRQQLVITSEAEREAAIASLERQRTALSNILNVTRSRLQQELDFVRQYEQKSFLGQIVSGDSLAADAAMRSARELERQVAELEQQLSAVDAQLAQTRTLTIATVVEPPPPGSPDIPEDGSTVTVNVEVNDPAEEAKRWVARLEAELRFGLKGPSEVIDLLSPRVEELREDATNALAEFGIDSQQYQDTVAKLDVLLGLLEDIQRGSRISLTLTPTAEVAAPRPLGIMPTATADLTGLRSVADIERDLAEARARVRAAATTEARVEAQAVVFMLEEELKRVTTGISLAIEPVARVLGEARQLAIEPTTGLPGARPLAITPTAGVGAFETIESIEADLRAAREAVRTAATAEARREAQLVVQELERELARVLGPITPRSLAITPTASVMPEPEPRQLGIEPVVQIDGMDPSKWVQAQEDAAAAQRQAGFDFAQTVITAGQGFVSAIEAFQAGNIGGGIAGLGGAVGGLFSGLGQLGGALGGLGPWGAIISAGAGLLGGLVNLFGGGGQSDRDRAAAEQRRVGNVPSIELHFTVNQTNNYQGGPSQPENEQAFRRQANALWEELYRRHLGPRLDRIEQRLGIAGAGA